MKKLNHFKNKAKKNLTFMVIPHSSEKIIQVSIPQWLTASIAFSITLITIGTIVFSTGYFSAKQDLVYANNQITELQLENETQKYELTELRNYSAKVDEKLADLDEIQTQVLSLVGLDTANTLPQETEILFSYSHPSDIVSRSGESTLFSSQGYEEEINFLTELVDREKNNMKKLISDVEDQLEYLDALPNILPVDGTISSPFGYRISPTGRRREFHSGVDIANKLGTDILASGSGVVTFSGYNGSYGRVVMISHGYGYTSIYAHNQKNLVSVGDRVEKGQVIAKLGSSGRSTGPHTHFEVRFENEPVDPLTLIEN